MVNSWHVNLQFPSILGGMDELSVRGTCVERDGFTEMHDAH